MGHLVGNVTLPDVKIPSGAAVSNAIYASACYDDAYAIILLAPAALDAHTYVLETEEVGDGSGTWRPFQVNAVTVNPPGAGNAQTYFELSSTRSFRIHDTSGNVAADRIWKCEKKATT